MLYRGRWCPICNVRFNQKVMGMYMEKIFGVPFPETSLSKAYKLSRDRGGLLRFDGYNAYVTVGGETFRIAFEYDGEQHDIYPNSFHKTLQQFEDSQRRDALKINRAQEHSTIIIRLKKTEGFHQKTFNLFQDEIIRQFNNHPLVKAKRVSLSNIRRYTYDKVSDSLKAEGTNKVNNDQHGQIRLDGFLGDI